MELHGYQNKIIRRCAERDRLVLSVGMGLGKTAAVLHYINLCRFSSVLIVAPKRVAEAVWLQEAEKWELEDIARLMVVVTGTADRKKKAMADRTKPYKIISRDNLKYVPAGVVYDLLVLDELTSFKNPLSERSRMVYGIQARRRIGLTGTLLANGAVDIYGQAAAAGIFHPVVRTGRNGRYKWCDDFNRWRDRYFVDVMKNSGQSFEKWKLVCPLEEVIKPIRDSLFTLSSEDYLQIPDVTYTEHKVQMTEPEYSNYLHAESMLVCDLDSVTASIDEKAKFIKLQTLCNGFLYDETGQPLQGRYHTKLEAVADFVCRCVAENERVLLFYAYTAERDYLRERLEKEGLRTCNAKDKGFLTKWEQHLTDVLLAHPASAGHGLNLQYGGRIIVWSSITYNFEYWAQANARLARQGQTQKVQIHTFATVGTIEQRQYKAVRAKEAENDSFVALTK